MQNHNFKAGIFILVFCFTLPIRAHSSETQIIIFSKFIGTWTLLDNHWTQRWDRQNTESFQIPNHFTTCKALNTALSILCVVNSPDLKGHILWSFDPVTQTVHHLSSFGESRIGVGQGTIDEKGNLHLSIAFAGEGANTYRQYTYNWEAKDRYSLMSRQFENGVATSNFYAGTFVRISQ
jgi:hypothetical protein